MSHTTVARLILEKVTKFGGVYFSIEKFIKRCK